MLEEAGHTRVIRNEMDIVLRESKDGLRRPQFLKHPVANRDDFEALRERLDPMTRGRCPADWDTWVDRPPETPLPPHGRPARAPPRHPGALAPLVEHVANPVPLCGTPRAC
ncbi:MAG TPA: hypothetical protein VNE39_23090 [Planctomycetota bacterium]|nr:hypothetical protein [Planctomycetota bacterium]